MNGGKGVDLDYCSIARCRQASSLIVLGEPLCAKHWQARCDADAERYAREHPEPLILGTQSTPAVVPEEGKVA